MPTDTLPAHYKMNGYVILENALTSTELETLRRHVAEIVAGRVSFPKELVELEPEVNGETSQAAVRKIDACAQHDAVFRAHAAHDRILDVVASLIGPDVKLFGSQCFMKPPGGIDKPYHQDSYYFAIEPRELVTCWTALDDVTIANGCLWVIPGSHRGPLLDHDQPWMVGDRQDVQVREQQLDRSQEVPIELRAGSCSFHHSMLLHRSGPNRTDKPRRGLAVHYVSARSRWTHRARTKPSFVLLRGESYEGCV